MNIGIIGRGFVGNAVYQKFKTAHKVYVYDLNDHLSNSTLFDLLQDCKIIFICVPTPVKKTKPDLKNLKKAFKTAGDLLNYKGILVNESTVYPGLTRELGLKFIQKKIIY